MFVLYRNQLRLNMLIVSDACLSVLCIFFLSLKTDGVRNWNIVQVFSSDKHQRRPVLLQLLSFLEEMFFDLTLLECH